MSDKKQIKNVNRPAEHRFTKEQVLASKKLTYSRDLINALFEADKTYTLKEIDDKLNKFLKRKVK